MAEQRKETTTNEGNSSVTTDMEKALGQEAVQQLTMQDDRIVKVDTGYINDVPTSIPNLKSDMNAAKMSSEDLMRMPLITRVVQWSNTNTRNDVLTQFDLPSIFNEIDLYHKRVLELYGFINFTLRMDFRINTTPFHSGRLVAVFDPMDYMKAPAYQPGNLTRRELNVFRASMQPSVEIDAGINNVASLDIPWEHYLSYINMNNDTGSKFQNGTVYVLVQNPLRTPTNAPNEVSLNIFVSCKDVNLEIPVRPHALQFTTPAVGVRPNSDIAHTVTGGIADAMTGNFGGALSKGVGLLGKLLDLDKPAKLDTKVTNCLSSASPLAHTVGIDGSVRLSTDPESSYIENHFSNAPVEEKKISEIVQTRCLFDIKTWSIDQVTDETIAEFKVRPGLYGMNRSQVAGSTTIWKETPTYLSYLEKAFRFWSGSIVFKFKFAASQNHSGKLQFSFEPTITPKAYGGETVSDFSQGPNVQFDLKESKTLEFHIPYVADRAQLYTSNLTDPSVDLYGNAHCLGILRVKVVNQLTTTGNIADSIEMNCYIAGGPDFEFDTLAIAPNQALYPFEASPGVAVRPNMDTDTVKTRAEDRDKGFSIVKGSQERTKRDRFNDRVDDVRDACKRYGMMTEDGIPMTNYAMWPEFPTATTGILAGNRAYLVGATSQGSGRAFFSAVPLFYFSDLYVFKSGSYRYKFVPMVDRMLPIIFQATFGVADYEELLATPSPLALTVNNSYPSVLQNSSQDCTIEVETPYYSIFNQHLVSNDVNTPKLDNYSPYSSGLLHLVAKGHSLDSLPADPVPGGEKILPLLVYISAGNDFNLRYLISPRDIYSVKTA